MNIYLATEQAYKNGYADGYKDGKDNATVYAKWERYVDEDGNEAYRCYMCHQPLKEELDEKWHYCPKCGAKNA